MQTYRGHWNSAVANQWNFRSPSNAMSAPITRRRKRSATGHWNTNAYAAWLENRTAEGSFEEFARDRFIIGDKVSVKEEIARYRELPGVDHFIMRCQWPACRRNAHWPRPGASARSSPQRARSYHLSAMSAVFRFDPVVLPLACEALRAEVREFITGELAGLISRSTYRPALG
jgi:hypothetical protein